MNCNLPPLILNSLGEKALRDFLKTFHKVGWVWETELYRANSILANDDVALLYGSDKTTTGLAQWIIFEPKHLTTKE